MRAGRASRARTLGLAAFCRRQAGSASWSAGREHDAIDLYEAIWRDVPVGQLDGVHLVPGQAGKDDDEDDCAGQQGRQLGGSHAADEHYRCMLWRDEAVLQGGETRLAVPVSRRKRSGRKRRMKRVEPGRW